MDEPMSDESLVAATVRAAALEAIQRASGCNQDNEPGDWGRPCCRCCVCAMKAASAMEAPGHA